MWMVARRSSLWQTCLDQAQEEIDGLGENYVTGFYAEGHDETRPPS